MTVIHPAKAYLLRDYEQFMAHLAHAREDNGLSQTDLAKMLGITFGAIAHWEHGRRAVPGRQLFALANALGYDLALIPREDA